MATLQSIRNHGTILLVVVGIAMLAFILGDFLNGSSSFFNKNREYVAEIAGHQVHYTEYEAAKEQLTEVYKVEYGTSDINEDLSINIRNDVWQTMMLDYTLSEQAEKIGMDVTEEELANLCIGTNLHPIILQRRAFYDETGKFNKDYFVNFLSSLEQEPESAEHAELINQYKNYWNFWENTVRVQYLTEKYTNLLSKTITANNIDAKYEYQANHESVSVQYVQLPYNAVADSLVKVTEGDIKNLYKQNKEQYKQTPNRSILYVTFPIQPSAEDFAEVEKLMKSLENDFRTKEDIAAIVNSNSDILYDARDYSELTIPQEYKDFAFAKGAKKNQCTELTFANDTYSIARIMDCGYATCDSVKLAAIVNKEETNPEWVALKDLPAALADQAKNGSKGTTFTYNNGMTEQTVKILDKSVATPKVKLAILSRKVTASSKTYSTLYNQAKQFVVANNHADSIAKAAAKQGLLVRPAYALNKNTDKIHNLKNSREIVRWVFEAKQGQVSDVYTCGEQFVVAAVTEVKDGEYRSLEEVRNELHMIAANDKKAEYITKQLQGITTLEEAAKLFDTDIKSESNISLASERLGVAGFEPAVIGMALTIAPNTVSAPIEGNDGVYMISVGEKQVANGELNPSLEISKLNEEASKTIPYQAISLIQKKAEVVDNRSRVQ